MVEQRGTRRVPYGVWVEEREGGIPSFYLAHGLDRNGLRLRARHGPRRGLPLQMQLLVENERRVMTLRGEVEDVLDDAISVRFHALDEEHMAFIDDLVAEGIRDPVED